MVQKESVLTVADSCGVWYVKIFQIYRGFAHKYASVGNFVKVSVRVAKPNNFFKRGKKSKAIVIRVRSPQIRKDGSYVCLRENSCVLLKKRMTPRGKRLFGPIMYGVKKRKFRSTFIGIV